MDRNRDRDDRGTASRRGGRDEDDRGSRRESGRGREEDPPRRSSRGRDDDDDRGSSRGRSSYSYERRSSESVQRRASKGARDFDVYVREDIKMFKVNDGDNTIRPLPPTWPKPEHFGYDIWVHYGVGPGSQTYLCPLKMKGEPCPVCEERQVALDDGDEKYAKELEPKRRVLYYLIDRDHPKEGLQAWAAPWTVDRDITKVSVDKRSGEALPIDDPEGGYDIEFEKKGSKDRTEYLGVAIARRESSLGNDAALDFAVENPLPDVLIYYDYDHIAKAFGGGGAQRDRSDKRGRDEDDAPRRSSGRDRDDPPRRGSRDEDDAPRRSSRDEDPPRRGSRDADDPPRRGRAEEPELTWESVHEMTGAELEALVDAKNLSINPNKADSDDELADWICEDLDLKKGASKPREEEVVRRRSSSKPDEDGGESRLARMRRERGG